MYAIRSYYAAWARASAAPARPSTAENASARTGPCSTIGRCVMQSNPLELTLCGISLKNPVIAASGTFGFGHEYAEVMDVSRLGGISGKGLRITSYNVCYTKLLRHYVIQ